MIVQDLAGRGAERHRVLGIDAAFDGVAAKFDVALLERQRIAGGGADLLEDQVNVGDHLGHRMLDLDARIHLDEIELAVLVEEFDGADAEIVDMSRIALATVSPILLRAAALSAGEGLSSIIF